MRINKAVRHEGVVYMPGMEDELNAVLPADSVDLLTGTGALSGEGWTGVDGETAKEDEISTRRRARKPRATKKDAPKADADAEKDEKGEDADNDGEKE